MKSSTLLPLVVTIGMSVVGVVGDSLLKLASDQPSPLRSKWFYLGFAVYASTALGWVYVMRSLKLATIGVVYSVSMILLLAAMGVFVFKEPIGGREVAGLALAVASLVLLMRFA
jgi:drug/metabolite transporter (DMT)-like permease